MKKNKKIKLPDNLLLRNATPEQLVAFLKKQDDFFVHDVLKDHLPNTEKMIDEIELEGNIVIRTPSIPEIYKIEAFLSEMCENPYQLKLV